MVAQKKFFWPATFFLYALFRFLYSVCLLFKKFFCENKVDFYFLKFPLLKIELMEYLLISVENMKLKKKMSIYFNSQFIRGKDKARDVSGCQ